MILATCSSKQAAEKQSSADNAGKTTATGFEPVRAEPIGFQVQLLNLSDTLSSAYIFK